MTTYTPTELTVSPTAEEGVAEAGAKARPVAKPYINAYLAAILLGIVLFLAFFLTGNGLGASGGLNRLVVYLEDLIAPEHIDRTAYLITMAGGELNALDNWVVFMIIGSLIGGFVSGLIHHRVKVETNRGPQVPVKLRWVMAFLGGSLMGYGARFARGCTSGQALSGGAVLSVGSWAFMMAVFAGAYLLAYSLRKFWN